MTPSASRKASERQRRKAEGQVEYKGWLSAEDHTALVAMAREAGMTQSEVVSMLIRMPPALNKALGTIHAVSQLPRYWVWTDLGCPAQSSLDPEGEWVRHSDLTAAVGLTNL